MYMLRQSRLSVTGVTCAFHLYLLMITGLDRTYHAHHSFLVSHFNFFCLFRVVDSAAGYPSAFYCTLNTHYRIVSYRKWRTFSQIYVT